MNYEPERLRNTMSRNYITNRYQTYQRRKTTKGIRENVETTNHNTNTNQQ